MARPKKLSHEAIGILSSMEITGNEARITGGQLDRKLYQEVNAALEALGGKWNRGKKAHLFDGDPQAAIEQVTLDGTFSDEKRDFEFFETPPDLARHLVDLAGIQPGDFVIEPSCGNGALVAAILEECPDVEIHAFDIRDEAVARVQERFPLPNVLAFPTDFLGQTSSENTCDRVVMNPPFGGQKDIDHVLHAHRWLKAGGKLVSIMSAGVTFRQNRKTTDFRTFVEAHGGSIESLPENSFRSSGTSVRTCVVEIPA